MQTPNAPPDAAVARFLADLIAIDGVRADHRFGLCVSGGADSLALLLLAHAALPGQVEAATVDHGLRAEAAGEAQHVAALCGTLGVAHRTLALTPLPDGNVSAEARLARYRALADWQRACGLDVLVTAHHADDQLETIVMRLNRGSGVAGLAGVRRNKDGVVRPLLGWRHAALADIVRACGVTPVDDPANSDDRYDRARLRKALATANWLDPVAATRSAAALAEAESALDWAARHWAGARVTQAGDRLTFDPRELPRELVRRILIDCVRRIDAGASPRGPAVAAAVETLAAGGTATLGGVKCAGNGVWTFTRAAPRRVRPKPPCV